MQENKPVLELKNTEEKSVSGIEMEENYFSLHPILLSLIFIQCKFCMRITSVRVEKEHFHWHNF